MIPIVVVIPCRNEAASIGTLVSSLLYDEFPATVTRVIVVDDGSTDDTAARARAAGASVLPMAAEARSGLASVYRFGLCHALGLYGLDAVYVEMDAGGSHDPWDLPNLVRPMYEQRAIVVRWDGPEVHRAPLVVAGRRFGPDARYEAHWKRRWLSRLGTWLANALHGVAYWDATSGYVAYTGVALAQLVQRPWRSRGHYYQTELRLRARALGIPVQEAPIHYRGSGSSLNGASVWEALRLVFRRP